MPDERESPSAGWREVCDEMDADPDVEDATHPCPDCGRTCENVLGDVYECEEHGVFRASAGDRESSSGEGASSTGGPSSAEGAGDSGAGEDEADGRPNADDPEEVENRTPGRAD